MVKRQRVQHDCRYCSAINLSHSAYYSQHHKGKCVAVAYERAAQLTHLALQGHGQRDSEEQTLREDHPPECWPDRVAAGEPGSVLQQQQQQQQQHGEEGRQVAEQLAAAAAGTDNGEGQGVRARAPVDQGAGGSDEDDGTEGHGSDMEDDRDDIVRLSNLSIRVPELEQDNSDEDNASGAGDAGAAAGFAGEDVHGDMWGEEEGGDPPQDHDEVELEDEAAEAHAAAAAAGQGAAAAPKLGTAAYYDSLRHEPVWSGATVSVEQYSYYLLVEKRNSKQRDTAFDKHVRWLHAVGLPQPNVLPPSLYLIRKLIGCRDVVDYEYHICVKECCSWDFLHPRDFEAHAADKCPVCMEPRFHRPALTSGKLKPRRVFYDFGLAKTIRQKFFGNPAWCMLRGTKRDMSPAGMWGASAAKAIAAKTNQKLYWPTSSAYELGHDYGQIFGFAKHSTGILLLRCFDLPAHARGKHEFVAVLLVIPGPYEPKDLTAYLRRTLEAFKQYGPAGDGLRVTEVLPDEQGSYRKNSFNHHVFLTGSGGDGPARFKLAKWPGVAAYLACGWCRFQGQKFAGSAATRFLGYDKPVQHDISGGGAWHRVGDKELLVSDDLHHARARLVEQHDLLPSVAGCTGYSLIPKTLDYVSYSDIWILGLCHSALYGPVKGIIGLSLASYSRESERPWYVIPHSKRRIMRRRGAGLRLTADIGRPYKCIVDDRGSYQLDDWLYFLETYSLHVLDTDMLEPRMQEMWVLLRGALLHYFRYQVVNSDPCGGGSSFHPSARAAAAANLRRFAVLVEKQLPVDMCSFNLHVLVCRLPLQEAARGHPAKDMELWIERAIQYMKGDVKYRTTMYPEKIFVKSMLTDLALSRIKLAREVDAAAAKLKDFNEWVPEYSEKPLAGDDIDEGDPETGSQVMGHGRAPTAAVRERLTTLVSAFLYKHPRDGWTRQRDPPSAKMDIFTRAHRQGDEIITSQAYGAFRTRCSYIVQVRFQQGQDAARLHAAFVKYFVRVRKTSGGRNLVLRLAVCSLYAATQRNEMLVVNTARPVTDEVALDLENLDCKLIAGVPTEGAQPRLHLMKSMKVSGMA